MSRPAADVIGRVHAAVAASLDAGGPVVLAVSGGMDSMVLLDAAAAVARGAVAAVATFDHATGAAAWDAARLVARRAAALGLPVRTGRADAPGRSEAEWRAARWTFLRRVAAEAGAVAVATAHTRDDQVETVALRVLRGAGPRGLAGMAAGGDVRRPLIELGRADVERYARVCRVEHVVDPSNADRRHLRNRLRLDLLPALERARPGFAAELLGLAERAAGWRADVELIARRVPAEVDGRGALHVARAGFSGYDALAAAVVWPALAARVGVVLDRRGTARLAEFTTRATAGAVMQLSGGVEVLATARTFVLAPGPLRRRVVGGGGDRAAGVLVDGGGPDGWRFARAARGDSAWRAWLPSDAEVAVRAWRPGDRMRARADGSARRVKRFFADARVPARERDGWPVVLVEGEIVWIPGVRRSDAATDRSGRPGAWYRCERDDC